MNLTCQRDLFSLPDHVHYLNCATFGPLSKLTEDAGKAALILGQNPLERSRDLFFEPVEETKVLFGKLVNALSENIAIIPSVSYGVAMVAKNISLSASDEVLLLDDQFPSNYYTWSKKCKQSGAMLKVVRDPKSKNKSHDWNIAIQQAIGPKTKVVTMSNVHWMDGTYFDLLEIKKRCQAVGAFLIIDGTQSVGALPFDVRAIQPDALLVAGYKWMLGAYGIGYAYLGPRLISGEPLEENWINRYKSEDFENLTQYTEKYKTGASRFSMGEQSSFISIAMANASLKLINAWNPVLIQAYAKSLTQKYWDHLRSEGVQIDTANPSYHMTGLRLDHHWDMDTLRAALANEAIAVSQRGDALRISINVYNNAEDLEALTDVIIKMRN